jgi:hypothetical protein
MMPRAAARHFLGHNPGHFPQPIVCEILRVALFDRLQYEIRDEFGLVTIGDKPIPDEARVTMKTRSLICIFLSCCS